MWISLYEYMYECRSIATTPLEDHYLTGSPEPTRWSMSLCGRWVCSDISQLTRSRIVVDDLFRFPIKHQSHDYNILECCFLCTFTTEFLGRVIVFTGSLSDLVTSWLVFYGIDEVTDLDSRKCEMCYIATLLFSTIWCRVIIISNFNIFPLFIIS